MPPKKNEGLNKTLPKTSSPEPPPAKKSKAKPGTNKSDGTTVGSKGKAPAVDAKTPGEAEPKRMSVQQLIGGPSWTGKLPQTLLYEHCVKAGWNKPEYTTVPQAYPFTIKLIEHSLLILYGV
jgi:ATP-dependent RNA helicase DHX57